MFNPPFEKFQIPNFKSQINSKIQNFKSQINSKFQNPKSKIQNSKSKLAIIGQVAILLLDV